MLPTLADQALQITALKANVLRLTQRYDELRAAVVAIGGGEGGLTSDQVATLQAAIDAEAAAREAADAALGGGAVDFGDAEFNALSTAVDAVEANLDDIVSGQTVFWVDVHNYGAVGNGIADDAAAIKAAFDDMAATGGVLMFRRGKTYKVSHAVIGQTMLNVTIKGRAKIVFPSDDTSLGSDAAYENDSGNKRSGFYLRDCQDVTIEDLTFQGGTATTTDGNTGHAVTAYHTCQRLKMRNVTQLYGSGLVNLLSGSQYAVIDSCRSYGSRGSSRLGDGGAFRTVHFELPIDDNTYDGGTHGPGGVTGSSHAVYQYASAGSRVLMDGCTVVNYRLDGFKMSGSNLAMRGMDVYDSTFVNCGYNHDGSLSAGSCILFGADDVEVHSVFKAQGNKFYNCQQWITVLGAQNILITDNQGHRTTAPASPATALIQVTRYISTSQPLADCIVSNNIASSESASKQIFTAATTDVVTTKDSLGNVYSTGWETGFGPFQLVTLGTLPTGTSPSTDYYWIRTGPTTGKFADSYAHALAGTAVDITGTGSTTLNDHTMTFTTLYATVGVLVDTFGEGLTNRVSLAIVERNSLGQGLGSDISVVNGINPIVRGNSGDAGVSFTGCRMPRLSQHTVNDPTTANSVIKINGVSWPIFARDNVGSGRLSGTNRGCLMTTNNNGASKVAFPLLGYHGRASWTEGKPEVVFAYGPANGWTVGDTVNINGEATFTYALVGDSTHFSTLAELIALIEGMAHFTCSDYGSTWTDPLTSAAIPTGHIRVRWYQADATANKFYVQTTTARKIVGVTLNNGSGGSQLLCSSRGEGSNKLVAWTPCAEIGHSISIRPENSDGAAALAFGVPYPVSVDLDEGCCVVMQLGAGTISGTPTFQWSIQ